MKCFRCGWCGQPANNNGVPLELWQIAVIDPFVDWNEAEKVNGECCPYGDGEYRMEQVTREMALDAGIPEMEGSWINW